MRFDLLWSLLRLICQCLVLKMSLMFVGLKSLILIRTTCVVDRSVYWTYLCHKILLLRHRRWYLEYAVSSLCHWIRMALLSHVLMICLVHICKVLLVLKEVLLFFRMHRLVVAMSVVSLISLLQLLNSLWENLCIRCWFLNFFTWLVHFCLYITY